jgi:glycosyltransferase involved in cell wall biosynthesis
MKFSVIIPLHNGERYLKECLDSALAQKGDFELELVVVENGSKDGSAKICDEDAGRDDRIKDFHEGRIGAYEARRVGMRKASGDYVFFLDADDALKEGALQKLVGMVKALLPEIILYNAENMTDKGRAKFNFPFESGSVYSGSKKKAFYDVMCQGDSLNALWNKGLCGDLAKRVSNTPEDELYKGILNHGEDLVQTAQILDMAKSIVFVNEILYCYRNDNEGGLTTGYYEELFDEQEYAWSRLLHYASGWTDKEGEYEDIINARKALTCTIGVKRLIFSDLSLGEIKKRLLDIFALEFYREYAGKELPAWACEEDRSIHELQVSGDGCNALISCCRKRRLKLSVKKLLGRK